MPMLVISCRNEHAGLFMRLRQRTIGVKCYGSIDAMDSVKVPYICYLFDNSNMATSRMAVSKMASFCNMSCTHAPVCPHSYIRPLYWKATEPDGSLTPTFRGWRLVPTLIASCRPHCGATPRYRYRMQPTHLATFWHKCRVHPIRKK